MTSTSSNPIFQHVTNIAQQTDKQARHDTTDSQEENEEEEEEEEEKEDEEVEEDHRSKLKFLVKNMSQYKCVSTDKLKFLDIMSFIAPGFSYAKYLAAFEVAVADVQVCCWGSFFVQT